MSNLPSLIKGLQYVPITNTGLITTTDNNGADATVTYSVDDNLPLGLSINEATGVISGRPTSLGSGTFTITATGTGN
jgi:hypothetical protein